jgi:hypothetical protein
MRVEIEQYNNLHLKLYERHNYVIFKSMKITFLIFALSFTHFAHAQIKLTIDYNCKDTTPGFSNIGVIDNREGQKLLGYIHKGLGNNSKQIVFDGNIADSLAMFFQW